MKTPLWIAPAALTLLAACSVEGSEPPASSSPPAAQPAASSAPAAQPVVDEPLPTPEEEAAKAAQTIDESNADAELQRLQKELGGG